MNLNLTSATRYGLNVLALLGASIALKLGASIFIPVTISALLAAVLWQPANWFHQKVKLPWFFACLLAITLLVVLGCVIFFGLASSIPALIEDLKLSDTARQKELYGKIRMMVIRVSPYPIDDGALPADAEKSGFYQQIKSAFEGPRVTDALIETLKVGGGLFWEMVLVLFIVLFMLLEGDMLARKIRAIFGPGGDAQRRVTGAIAEMGEAVRTYLVWRTIVNFVLAIVLGAVYKFAGLKQWYLWAVLTAVLTYVPYLGTIAAGIPPIFDALLLSDKPEAAIGILIFYVGLVTFEGYIIVPWVMGRSMNLNATTVMLACLYWDLVWGTAGLFLAMPLMAAIRAVCLHVEEWRPWGLLMGSDEDEPVVPPKSSDLIHLSPVGEDEDPEKTTVMNGLDGSPPAKTVTPAPAARH
jgi:predicted PurR-regulated permease PerM